MSNKLQELTDRLYNEGLSKGKEEGEILLFKARKEADEIIANARKQAEDIVTEAENRAAQLKEKAESDIKMASEQALMATKKDIENLLVNALCAEETEKVLSEEKFLKEIILAVAQKFSTQQSEDISLVLPASLKSMLEPWVSTELKKALKKEISVDFSKKIKGGFSIGPQNGSWYISMSDESFKALISEYLRPVTKKLLFG
ncbi:MAG: hypothetical protein KIG34_03330 [Bacteroidales bacterium]|nr:hypothetical protein [Bacteroidales bacterium]MCI6680032.1 hypothetical protein [Bacteroides sp.]CCX54417.1 putative uncharacterized protein [Bacteroides sp. CAG:1060]